MSTRNLKLAALSKTGKSIVDSVINFKKISLVLIFFNLETNSACYLWFSEDIMKFFEHMLEVILSCQGSAQYLNSFRHKELQVKIKNTFSSFYTVLFI